VWQYRSLVDCARKTVQAEGAAGLYRGFSATLVRDLPSFAGYFFFYEAAKRSVSRWDNRTEAELTPFELLFCGGLAGFGAWLPAYPQDVLKSRMQSSPQRVSLGAALRGLLHESGWRGLFRGFSPTMARAFPANAATFMAFEAAQAHLGAW
jgi:solute carrier family 25 carnitine/acylcarnitine transporter 20/29